MPREAMNVHNSRSEKHKVFWLQHRLHKNVREILNVVFIQ